MKKINVKKIIKRLEKDGVLAWTENVFSHSEAEVFLVGGAVRDALLAKRDIKDFDFVVRGINIESLKNILIGLGRVELVGKNFGVLKFKPKNCDLKIPLDIALPRVEKSLVEGGYRDFDINFDKSLDIREDLGRRDFTINALAWNIFTGELIDEFNGWQDLKDKKIRTVGNPNLRFAEDYSRMLRAIRFACQLQFEIEEETLKAINKNIKNINKKKDNERVVPYEIIASEFLKAFVYNPLRAFDMYDKLGLFKELVPEVLKMKKCPQPKNWHSEGDVWAHTRLALKNLESKSFIKRFSRPITLGQEDVTKIINPELVMAVLFHDIGKPNTIATPEKDKTDRIRFSGHDDKGAKLAKEIFERLKLSAAPEFDFDPDRVSQLIAKHHLFDTQTVNDMKNSTVEKHFFSDKYSGEDLLKLAFVDISASLRENGEPDFLNFDLMVNRIEKIKKMGKGRNLPRPFLDGDEVMRVAQIKSGKRVGEILDIIREKQLSGNIRTKAEAIAEIKRLK